MFASTRPGRQAVPPRARALARSWLRSRTSDGALLREAAARGGSLSDNLYRLYGRPVAQAGQSYAPRLTL
jgi:hypothetical protein